MKGFFATLDEIDSVIAAGSSPENVDRLTALMTNRAASLYTFQHLSADWLQPLESTGYFRKFSDAAAAAPDAMPLWIATDYLKRLAEATVHDENLADTIQRILSFLPSPRDIRSARDYVEIAVTLPRVNRRGLVPVIQRSINAHAIEFAEVTKLLNMLAADGESAATVRLLCSLFAVIPGKAQAGRDPSDISFPAEPVGLMDSWHYGNELSKCLPSLTRQLGMGVLRGFVRLLSDHLRFSNRESTFQGPDDYSYIWRPAIETHEQNIHDDVRDHIVSAIRDSATIIVTQNPSAFAEVIELLDEQQWFVFTRVALHLLGVSPAAPLYLIERFLTQSNLFNEIGVRHEYSLLLKARFVALSDEQQNLILKRIDSGPDFIAYRSAIQSAMDRLPDQSEEERYVRQWKFDWLSFIAPHLPDAAKAQYLALRLQFGTPIHPEFPYFTRSRVSVGYSSSDYAEGDDSTAEQAIGQLIALADTPNEEQQEHKERRVLQRLSNLAAEDRSWVETQAAQLLRLPSEWLASILQSVAGASSSLGTNEIATVVRLAKTCSDRLRSDLSVDGSDEIKMSLAAMLEILLRNSQSVITQEQLPSLCDLGGSLLSTVRPVSTPEREKTDFDPLTFAINTPDGRIVDSCFKLALAARNLIGESAPAPKWFFEPLKEVLQKLPEDEIAISAILGAEFSRVVHLSREWAVENGAQVFPQDARFSLRWAAAWGSYITYSGVYANVYDILEPQYHHAIRQLAQKSSDGKSRIDFGKGLAQHLPVLFWHGRVNLNDSVLQEFFRAAGSEPIGTFLWSLGRGMKEVPEFSAELGKRLRDLAEWLTFKWTPPIKESLTGLRSLGWWFPNDRLADPEWQLGILIEAATKAGRLSSPEQISKALADWSEVYPALVIDCLLALVQGSPSDHAEYYLTTHSSSILRGAFNKADAETREKIATIADYFGAHGHFEFREFASAS